MSKIDMFKSHQDPNGNSIWTILSEHMLLYSNRQWDPEIVSPEIYYRDLTLSKLNLISKYIIIEKIHGHHDLLIVVLVIDRMKVGTYRLLRVHIFASTKCLSVEYRHWYTVLIWWNTDGCIIYLSVNQINLYVYICILQSL